MSDSTPRFWEIFFELYEGRLSPGLGKPSRLCPPVDSP